MEDRKKANATNDDINIQADALTDLPVADEQVNETKGGAWKNGSVVLYDQTHTEVARW
jgi:hypothetical protein